MGIETVSFSLSETKTVESEVGTGEERTWGEETCGKKHVGTNLQVQHLLICQPRVSEIRLNKHT